MTKANDISLGGAVSSADIAGLLAALASPNKIVRGAAIVGFERAFADWIGAQYAVSFSAGRVALAALLSALEIPAGGEVIIPGYTCVAVPNPIITRGAIPIYADIEPDTLNLHPSSVRKCLSRRTRALLAQHTFGLPANLEELGKLVQETGITLIEDCTHALGSRLDGRHVGTFGRGGFFSFEQSKTLNLGQGGMAITNDDRVYGALRTFQTNCLAPSVSSVLRLLCHVTLLGINKDYGGSDFTDSLYYYFHRLGLARGAVTTESELRGIEPRDICKKFSNAVARLGIRKLKELSAQNARRVEIAKAYQSAFRSSGKWTVSWPVDSRPVFLRYPIRTVNKTGMIRTLARVGVPIGDWFAAPVHPHGVDLSRVGYTNGSCPNAEAAVTTVVNLPIDPAMNDATVDMVAELATAFAI